MELSFQNIEVSPRNTNIYYKKKFFPAVINASGCVRSGEIMAIMGPVGSGKTSLLNTLACRVPYNCKTNGEILLDGKPIHPASWMKRCSLVTSLDTYYDNVRVDDIIKQVANFRMSANDHKNINERANYYKGRLRLHDSSGKKFSSLNLDERKRLMILLEIMSDAQIICIEEPTGEMDILTAFEVVNTLKELAIKEQKIIIITLDQPNRNIYDKIDKVLLINDGQSIFCGPKKDLVSMLENNGIKNSSCMEESDFILQIFNKSYGYEEHGNYEKEIQNIIDQNTVEPEHYKEIYRGNNSVVNLMPKFDEISILFKRKVCGNYGSIFEYFRYFYLKLFFLIIATIFLIYFVKDRIIHPEKNIPNYANIPENVRNDFSFINLVSQFQKSYMIFCIPSIIALFSIYSLITAFSNESNTIIRELGTLSFSITSYYFATLMYEILVHIIPFFLIYTFIQIAFYDVCGIYPAVLFLTSIILLAPFVLLLGTISFEKKNIVFYSILLAFMTVIPPVFVLEQMQVHSVPIKIGFIAIGALYYLIPYHLYISFFGLLALKNIHKGLKDKFETEETKEFIALIANRIELCKGSGTGIEIPGYVIILLALSAPLFCMLVNISILRIKLKPEIRTILSKSNKKFGNEEIGTKCLDKTNTDNDNKLLKSEPENADEVVERKDVGASNILDEKPITTNE